jgi:hypothetical protein
MQTSGLRLEDAPQLEIPLSFFVTAPFFIMAAGVVLLLEGAGAISSRWSPMTIAFTHLGTLGVVTMVMLGASYQMIAVVVGSPIRSRWTAHTVHGLFVIGVPALCWGIAKSSLVAMWIAIATLGPGVLFFVLPVGLALRRAPEAGPTAAGMRLAVLCFFLLAVLGIWMAHGHAGALFPGPRDLWIQVHMGLALFGWVGGLLAAVSWQVLPMFYLAKNPARRLEWSVLGMTMIGTLVPVLVLALDWLGALGASPVPADRLAALAMLPAPIAVLVLHPAASLWSLHMRRRKRVDGSLLFWRAGLLGAPLAGVVLCLAWLRPGERWEFLFGWLLIWGWATTIIHGMLTRIVPFLVWLHRFAPHVGRIPVPSVKKLLPDAWTRTGFKLHLTTTLLGCAAMLSASDWLSRITGLALMATSAWLLRSILHVLRQSPPADAMKLADAHADEGASAA